MFRNREFRSFTRVFLLISIILVVIGFRQSAAAGMIAVFSAFIFGVLFLLFTRTRYKRIAQISDQIDLVLHNEDHLFIEELDEGELSILQSEIAKMTLRIREQNVALQKEKENLADSLADIAHQLRTPLTSVNLILSLAAENSDEKQRKMNLREIETLLLQMDHLITALLKLSRLDADVVQFQNEPIHAAELIEHSLQPFLATLDLHDIQVVNKVSPAIMIQGDAVWLSEAIQNIFKNCIESIGEQGKLTIAGDDNPLFTEIIIHDSGKGLEPTDIQHLFDRFYRGEDSSKMGFGIGLSLSKSIIKRQGGTITAKNHPQGGALFLIRFPK
ncbi:sensor histidine kinase [Candidatus Enterococcus murrayae]|uniref:histidine kinase n=1 Tax=Candidatus Enterococcus murrayae TaxID=2815321 RepID=A0ABS3HHN5_9ENTE|nr:HAMP domain-containing sensor histidine kinase [Enterococcus sp. MJM16]MBO0452967.1 HAMP domain-containing histidine kinase [Enterococcus sp. MJM16]